MAVSETQKDLLSYLDAITREFDADKLERHTTADIARNLSISRNLCSQYLNDLVRRGFMVKAGTRPIYYFHQHDLERYLQVKIDCASYATVGELLALRGVCQCEGFERAIGYDLSLSTAVSQMCTALAYPPCGLPVLIAGASGTGKTYLANLMLTHAKGTGLLDGAATVTAVDCAQYLMRPLDIIAGFEGTPGQPGWLDTAKGGLLLFKHVDMLPESQQEYLFTHALFAARAEQGEDERGLRFAFTTMAPDGSEAFRRLEHRLPVVAVLPPLHQRSPQERRDFVLHFLRDEGRRMGVDVHISTGALCCLVNARYEDNISELRRSITNACAEAYLVRGGSSAIEVRTYNLPASVLMSVDARQAEGDGRMIDATRLPRASTRRGSVDAFDGMVQAYDAFLEKRIDDAAFEAQVVRCISQLEQQLAQGQGVRGPRLVAFERLLGEAVSGVNDSFGIGLSHAMARVAAQLAYLEIWPDEGLLRWRGENRRSVEGALTLVAARYQSAALVTDRLAEVISRLLGITLGAASRLLLLAHIALLERADEKTHLRDVNAPAATAVAATAASVPHVSSSEPLVVSSGP